MLKVPDNQLKLTIRPGVPGASGLALDVSEANKQQVVPHLQSLAALRSHWSVSNSLQRVFTVLQTKLVDYLYNGGTFAPLDAPLKGPRGSTLAGDVFLPVEPQLCDPQTFMKRTLLKIKRTDLNVKELLKAYPDNEALHEVQFKMSELDTHAQARVLRTQVLQLIQESCFQEYLDLKEKFLEDWIALQQVSQGKFDPAPLSPQELSGMMKALLEQKSRIEQNPEVLKYKNQQFFRAFNGQQHSTLNSDALDFWRTEENLQWFLKLVAAIRHVFADTAPFIVLRFEHSFTYLLCGFSDESLIRTLESKKSVIPAHLKIIMRQSNQVYRELTSYDANNQTLYFNCLKEALRPFIVHLNQRLHISMPDSFIHFFEV